MSVITFERGSNGLVSLGRHATLGEASAILPDGAYTTFRTYPGRRVLRLGQHVLRLVQSAALEGTPGALELESVREAVGAVLDATAFAESRFRLTFAPPRFFLSVEPFVPLASRLYDEGVACVTVSVRRPNPEAKDTRFIATAAAAHGALPQGVEEGLMRAEDGSVLEGLSSNFFAVRGERLFTEEHRVLKGVTRALVLEVGEEVLPIERVAVRPEDGASECFITSVSREVLPVVRIDGRPIGDGRPGFVTREIARRFASLVDREAQPM